MRQRVDLGVGAKRPPHGGRSGRWPANGRMNLQAITDRMTYLLEGQQVESVRQDSSTHLTLKFVNGPLLLIGLLEEAGGEIELDCSITAWVNTSEAWVAKAENLDAPWPVKR